MVLFSHKQEWSTDTCYNINENWKQCVKWKKPDQKGHILYDSDYMKHTKQANKESRLWLQGAAVRVDGVGNEEWLLTVWSLLFEVMKWSGVRWKMAAQSCEWKVIELYTLKEWILWNVNYI